MSGARTGNSAVDGTQYLLRLERMQPDRDSCVLVGTDGQFHFERLSPTRTDILEGVSPLELMDIVRRAVSDEELLSLTQDKVRLPLQHSLDDVFISIRRTAGWQNLKFLGTEGREPYRQQIDPLLKLLDMFPDAKHKALSEDAGRNNCMPPGDVELITRTGRQSMVSQESGTFVLRIAVTNKSEYNVKNMCAVVYPEGRYHLEKWTQRHGSVFAESTVLEGRVGENALQELKALLDALDLRSRPEAAPEIDFPVWQADITRLSVRRGERLQQMAFWEYVGAKSPGSVYTPPHRENGTKAIKPLRQWWVKNLEANVQGHLVDTPPSRCE